MRPSSPPDLSEPEVAIAQLGSDKSEVFGAIDIGASSGRVVAGWWADGKMHLDVVHRFPNGAAVAGGHLRWDLTGLYEQVLKGLTVLAERYPEVVSLGIDTWAVDYGLLGADGRLLAEPIAYRDDRTEAVIGEVHARVDPAELYAVSGLQFLPFNTLYQLTAERRGPNWSRAQQALLLPDLLAFWLTDERRTEITNASTTGLLDARSRSWSTELFAALDLPVDLFPLLVEPGEVVGTVRPTVAEHTGLPASTTVVAVGSHDTASAVVGVPAADDAFAYVSSGTWSLVGVELDQPVLTEASRAANFTNEGGVDGRVRYLRNVGGLWLLQESLRTWREAGEPADQDALLAEAAQLPAGGPVVDVDAPEFIAARGHAGPDPRRLCRGGSNRSRRRRPHWSAAFSTRSLMAYAKTVASAVDLTGQPVDVVHIVGGGSQNALLCQLTADLSDRPVLAGPIEATALGNLAVQARSAGVLPAKLDELRTALRGGLDLARYEPAATADTVAAEVG